MKCLLIGGTSHCGKSTLAQKVAAALGWGVTSTDQLARHPGRPWLNVPEPVKEFYATMSPEAIYWFYRVHHSNMWPLLERVIREQRLSAGGFVLEGSALRPEQLSTLQDSDVLSICLHANPSLVRERIRSESGYEDQDVGHRRLIDIFTERSLRDNQEIAASAQSQGIWLINVSDAVSLAQGEADILARLSGGGKSRGVL